MTTRRSMSPSRRLRIFEAHGGVCCHCGLKIDGVREAWIVEHLLALGLTGADDDANCAPAHEHCRRVKDKDDVKRIAKAKRAKQQHLGIRPPSRLRGRGFEKAEPQRRATRKLEKWRGWTNETA